MENTSANYSSNIPTESLISLNENPEHLFCLLELLGEGSYGKVYKAQHVQNRGIYAVKIVNTTAGDLDNLKKEICILRDCSSEYVVQYYGSYLYNEQLWLIMEYCEVGSVSDLMRATQRTLSELHIACVLKSMLSGLSYLHNTKKIHRDVKAGNVLINQHGAVKLADFGVSAELIHTLGYIESFIGTPFWMSPEILSKSKYNKKTDIWSMGITAIEMAEGVPPYSNMSQIRAIMEIVKNPPKGLTDPSRWSNEFNQFVSRCLTIDPEQRPTAEELLKDPFIIRYTSRVNSQLILAELILKNMDKITLYRRALFEKISQRRQQKAQPQTPQGNPSTPPTEAPLVQQQLQQQNQKKQLQQQHQQQQSSALQNSDQNPIEQNRQVQYQFNQQQQQQQQQQKSQQDYIVNESGTLIEYSDNQQQIKEGQTPQYSEFYKKTQSSSEIVSNCVQNSNVWENETGTMIQKNDEVPPQQLPSPIEQPHKLYTKQNIQSDQSMAMNEEQEFEQLAQNEQHCQSIILKLQRDREQEINAITFKYDSLILLQEKQLFAIRNKMQIKMQQHHQSFNGIQQQQQSQKQTPRGIKGAVPATPSQIVAAISVSPDKVDPIKYINMNANNMFAEIPLPPTPKSKENNPRNANVYSVQTQPASSQGYSSSQLTRSSARNIHADTRTQGTPKQQEDVVSLIKKQFLINSGVPLSKQSLQAEEIPSQYVKRSNNHPINLLNQPNKDKQSGLTFDEALNRKQLMKKSTNNTQSNNNTSSTTFSQKQQPNRIDENLVYVPQTQAQQRSQQVNSRTKDLIIGSNTPSKNNYSSEQPLSSNQNLLQQRQFINNRQYIPSASIERMQTEQSHFEANKKLNYASFNDKLTSARSNDPSHNKQGLQNTSSSIVLSQKINKQSEQIRSGIDPKYIDLAQQNKKQPHSSSNSSSSMNTSHATSISIQQGSEECPNNQLGQRNIPNQQFRQGITKQISPFTQREATGKSDLNSFNQLNVQNPAKQQQSIQPGNGISFKQFLNSQYDRK